MFEIVIDIHTCYCGREFEKFIGLNMLIDCGYISWYFSLKITKLIIHTNI